MLTNTPPNAPNGPAGQFCAEHGNVEFCVDHGCPHCEFDEWGYGDCEDCNTLAEPEPDFDCPDGEDCLLCQTCSRCRCELATVGMSLCRLCAHCAVHTDPFYDCNHSWWNPVAERWVA